MRGMLRQVTRSLLIVLLGAACLPGSSKLRAWELRAPELRATEPESKPTDAVVLTAAQPIAHIPVQAEVWKEKRTSLEIKIVKIKNPQDAGFSVEVFLEQESDSGTSAKGNIAPAEIGALGVYPAGQTGNYRLEASSALRRLQASGANANHLCVRLELRQIHPKDPQGGLEVTLSAPQWLPAN